MAHAVSRDEAVANGTLIARVSGLPVNGAIRKVVAAVAPRPANVLIGPWGQFVPMDKLAAAGVKRVSLGSALFSSAMGHFGRVAARVAEGDLAASAEGMSALRFNAIFGG